MMRSSRVRSPQRLRPGLRRPECLTCVEHFYRIYTIYQIVLKPAISHHHFSRYSSNTDSSTVCHKIRVLRSSTLSICTQARSERLRVDSVQLYTQHPPHAKTKTIRLKKLPEGFPACVFLQTRRQTTHSSSSSRHKKPNTEKKKKLRPGKTFPRTRRKKRSE